MEVLDDILASLRLNGGVVFDARTTGAWRLVSRFEPEDCAPYFPVPAQVISYHYVSRGPIYAQLPGGEAVELRDGSIALFPRNDAHLLFTDPQAEVLDVAQFARPGGEGGVNLIDIDFGGQAADCYCGWLGVTGEGHPLLDALPAMLVIHAGDYPAAWVGASLQVAAGDWNANPVMVARLSELVFAEAVRRYVRGLSDGEGGWLAGLRDPAVARALSVIHARYRDDLDVDGLAREAGVSRSVLGERFGQLLGEPPMRYCARWRMRVAANRLLDGQGSAAIAHDVGFGSEAAFSRAFKREYGAPPAAWKRRIEAEWAPARAVHAGAA